MGELGLSGVRRGGAKQRTAIADLSAARPAALEDRHFNSRRPDATWVAEFTYAATLSGTVHVAFVIDVRFSPSSSTSHGNKRMIKWEQ
jgi:putative transposase